MSKQLKIILKIVFFIGLAMVNTAFMLSVLRDTLNSKAAAISLFTIGLGISTGTIWSAIEGEQR